MLCVLIAPTAPFRGVPVPALFPGEDPATGKNEALRTARAAARTLLLSALRETLGPGAASLTFRRNADGRPLCSGAYISFSHTDRYAAAAVSDAPCGVDIEDSDRFARYDPDRLRRLAGTVLTTEELALDPAPAPDRFLRLWTAKEAQYKAFGSGVFAPHAIPADRNPVLFIEHPHLTVALAGDLASVRIRTESEGSLRAASLP